MNRRKKRALQMKLLPIPITLAVLPYAALAQTQFNNPLKSQTFFELVEKVARMITAIGIPFVAIMIVWAGFTYVTAMGNEKKLEQAKQALTWALVGAAIVVGAYTLATAVANFAKIL